MIRKFSCAMIVQALILVSACEGIGSPTSPGGIIVPPLTIPANSEVYTSPRVTYIYTSSGIRFYPEGCLKVIPTVIDPGRGSVLGVGSKVTLKINISVCADAPTGSWYGPGVEFNFRPTDETEAFLSVGGWMVLQHVLLMPGDSKELAITGSVTDVSPPVLRYMIHWSQSQGGDVVYTGIPDGVPAHSTIARTSFVVDWKK